MLSSRTVETQAVRCLRTAHLQMEPRYWVQPYDFPAVDAMLNIELHLTRFSHQNCSGACTSICKRLFPLRQLNNLQVQMAHLRVHGVLLSLQPR
jgi:hypothetical protein